MIYGYDFGSMSIVEGGSNGPLNFHGVSKNQTLK